MVGGQDRYYQIVRCLRDEDAARRPWASSSPSSTSRCPSSRGGPDRADRAALRADRARDRGGRGRGAVPAYDVSRDDGSRYGSDKPDLRYGMELVDLAPVFAEPRDSRRSPRCSPTAARSRRWPRPAPGRSRARSSTSCRGREGTRRRRARVDGRRGRTARCARPSRSSSRPRRSPGSRADRRRRGRPGLHRRRRADRANVALDGLRRDLAARLELIPDERGPSLDDRAAALRVDSDEEARWVSVHHPFTSPTIGRSRARDREGARVRPRAERLRGRRRQHPDPRRRDPADASSMVLQLSPAEQEEQFGHLLRAFTLGAPPHGGIAMGRRPSRDAARGQGDDPRRHRLPEGAVGQPIRSRALPPPSTEAQLRDLGLALDRRTPSAGRPVHGAIAMLIPEPDEAPTWPRR